MARKSKPKRVSTVGRIVPVTSIRNRVYRELETIAQRLAPVRALAWRLYGSRAALGRSPEIIRDVDWMGDDGRAAALGVQARVWKATLDDVLGDIRASRAAVKDAVTRNLYRRGLSAADLITQRDLLRQDAWLAHHCCVV